jgi:transcriptional regulator GlxA family with amidase domain
MEQIAEQFQQPLTLEQLAATYGQNELRFLRDFTHAIGLTPHAYLIEVRLQAARRMIEHTDLPLTTIALEVGFAHQSHMGGAFRKYLAMTPRQYRSRF